MVRIRTSVLPALAVGFLLAISGSAHAESTAAQTVSTGLRKTNYSTTLNFAKFNTSLGTLNSVTISLFGTVNGTQQFENLDAEGAEVDTTTSALLRVTGPSGNLLSVTPAATRTTDTTAFDGTQDYAGTSGATYTNVTATSNTVTLTTANGVDLSGFAGTGDISLGVSARGMSSGTGSGNLATLFSTDASATVSVVYNYTRFSSAAAPEPGSLALLGTGVLGVAGMVVRRRAK